MEPEDCGAPAPPRTPSPPIYLSSYFESAGDPDPAGFHYTRDGNPNWVALEAALGELERAGTLVFGSGMAAIHALLLALTEDRTRVVMHPDGYYEARRLASRMRGLEIAVVDAADEPALREALAVAPSVLLIETPTNPLLRVIDIERIATIAAESSAQLAVDNTVATAALQRPLDLGAAATVYSLTKSVSGHSDVLLGAVSTRDAAILERLRDWRHSAGAIAGPFESWLTLRGIQTLHLRIERQSSNALAAARYLATHPRVTAVHYPGIDEATYAVAAKQMRGGFGPLLSFEVEGGAAEADAVIAAARVIRPGTSFGGVESSWERRSRWKSETAPASLIRLSAGIEAEAVLLDDLARALRILGLERRPAIPLFHGDDPALAENVDAALRGMGE